MGNFRNNFDLAADTLPLVHDASELSRQSAPLVATILQKVRALVPSRSGCAGTAVCEANTSAASGEYKTAFMAFSEEDEQPSL